MHFGRQKYFNIIVIICKILKINLMLKIMKRSVFGLLKRFSVVIIFIFSFICCDFEAKSQVFTGGDLSVTFTNGVNVNLAPIIGYKVKGFSAGLSPVVMYTATGSTSGDFSFGGRIFAEYDIWKGIFVQVEGEALNTGYIDNITNVKLRNWAYAAPIGVGYEYEITKNVWFKGSVLYDVLKNLNLDQNSSTSNPIVRGGIVYTF